MVISDLRHNHDLIIYCMNRHCHRHVRFSRDEAIAGFGVDFPLATIRDRGRCASCGGVGAETIVQFVGKTGRSGAES